MNTPLDYLDDRRLACNACGSVLSQALLDLPALPISDIYLQAPSFGLSFLHDQQLFFCDNCNHAQLGHHLSSDVLYSVDGLFRTSNRWYGAALANDVFGDFIQPSLVSFKPELIVEIGCGDGYLLSRLSQYASATIGVDPLAHTPSIAQKKQPTIITERVEDVCFKNLIAGRRTLFVASLLLEHLQNPKAVLMKLAAESPPDAVLSVQVPGLDYLLRNHRFDQVFHHHLHYFSCKSLITMMESSGWHLADLRRNHQYWGLILAVFTKTSKRSSTVFEHHLKSPMDAALVLRRYAQFKVRMAMAANFIEEAPPTSAVAFGASMQLPALFYHMGSAARLIDLIIDDDDRKSGLYLPHVQPKIIGFSSAILNSEISILVTAMNQARTLLPRLLALSPRHVCLPFGII